MEKEHTREGGRGAAERRATSQRLFTFCLSAALLAMTTNDLGRPINAKACRFLPLFLRSVTLTNSMRCLKWTTRDVGLAMGEQQEASKSDKGLTTTTAPCVFFVPPQPPPPTTNEP